MYNPVATYRVQFHKGFTFSDFEQVIPYLERLGVGLYMRRQYLRLVPVVHTGTMACIRTI